MFNFITKPELLPLSKAANLQHFYDFQAKQIQQKQNHQIQKLQQLKNKIQSQEEKPKQKKPETHKPIPSNDSKDKDFSKSYMLDSSLKSQQKARPNSTKSFQQFYQKNKKWKENLEAEIMKRKQQKIQQEERQLSECRKPLSQKQTVQNLTGKQNQNLTHAFDSKGPISGWTERFHSYIKKRLPQEAEQDFKPKINKKSQIIASRMVGKVEDRLIKFGQIMKMRKHEMMIEELQKIGKLPNSDQHFSSTNSNKSEFFHRLYKEGEKTNRKTKQKLQEVIQNQFSYKPKITKLDQIMEKKVKQKRQKSPLYTTKKMSKQETQRLMAMFQKQTGKIMKESDFQNFMRRNELLLEKKDKNLERKLREEMKKAENEMKECTFIPILNKKSMRMIGRIENGQILETQEQNEQFYQSEEKFHSRRFDKINEKNQSKSANKYNYEHSYTETHEFEYSINTPSAEKYDRQNFLQLRTQTKSKQNQISEIDSLEFSGQKHPYSNIFDKHNFSSDNISSQNYDQIINYELTFSNKKLTKQLNSLNDQISEEIFHQQFSQSNQKQKKQIGIAEDSIQAEVNQSIQNKTINDWQNQLQKVKNRLQNLMKSNKKIK